MKHTSLSFILRLLAGIISVLLLACGCASNGVVSNDTVVATVGDTNIPFRDFTNLFSQYYESLRTSYDLSDPESLKTLRTAVLDDLVDQEVLYQKAAASNPVLTQEEQDYMATYAENTKNSLIASYEARAQQANAEDVSAKALELLNADLVSSGYRDLEDYVAMLDREVTRYITVEAFKREFAQDITVAEDAVLAQYEQDVTKQTTQFDQAPADYETMQTQYDTNGGYPPVYVPADYIRVKHILVSDLDAANDLVEQINAGSDFDELMAQYGTDPGMQQEPNKSLGYLVCANTNFVQSFKDAAFALKNVGDISAPTESMHGYHIIRLEKIIKAGEVPFDDVKDAYTAQLLLAARNEAITSALEQWRSEAKIQRFTTVINNYLPEGETTK